jgi:hypothetical protein
MQKIKYLLTDDNCKKYYYLILNDIEYILYDYHKSIYGRAFFMIPNDIFQDLDTMDVVLNNSSLYTIKGEILKYPFVHFNGYYKNKNENKRKIKLAILLKNF